MTNAPKPSSDRILEFWFGDHDGLTPTADKADMWFGNGRAYDAQIRETFGELLEFAAAGSFDGWMANPSSSLALTLILDQFPRHVHRDSARAFAYDAKAREVCMAGLDADHPSSLTPLERCFYYLPLAHSEDRALQERSVALYESLLHGVTSEHAGGYQHTLTYAITHRDIIVRFDRFPHRNALLQRDSTGRELDFLSEPGSSFL